MSQEPSNHVKKLWIDEAYGVERDPSSRIQDRHHGDDEVHDGVHHSHGEDRQCDRVFSENLLLCSYGSDVSKDLHNQAEVQPMGDGRRQLQY